MAGPNSSIQKIEATLRENYARYQYYFVEFLSEHLADTSRTFKGDMQMAVILAIIGQSHLNALNSTLASGGDVNSITPEKRGISTSRISDVTGIPRETARRKLMHMESNGWIQRHGNFWILSMRGNRSAAHYDLEELNDRAIRRAARFWWNMASLTRDA